MNTIASYMKAVIRGEKRGPLILDISPTDFCNLHCISCWQRNEMFDGKLDSSVYQLSDQRLLSLIDEAAGIGVTNIEITGGGEPLMRKVTPELMRRIKRYGMSGSLTTNGTLFTEELIRELIELKWDRIVFSVDGYDERTQDYLRGRKGTFENNKKSLNFLEKHRKAAHSKTPETCFNTVISNVNYDQLRKVIEFAASVSCTTVNFETLTVHSKQGESLMLSAEQLREFEKSIDAVKRTADLLGVQTNIAGLKAEFIENSNCMEKIIAQKSGSLLSAPCYEPWFHVVVKVDGSIGPCCLFTEKKANIKNETLYDAWYGKFFDDIRKKMLKGNLSSYCRICNAGQVNRNQAVREALSDG